FADEACPRALWFTAGNHEDFEVLKARERGAGRGAEGFAVDAYGRLRCGRDGHVAGPPGGRRGGALGGVDPQTPRRIPRGGRISRRAAAALAGARLDVLLSHESPRGAILPDQGSEAIGAIIRTARPAFAFFGHYHRTGGRVEGDFGATRVYHL